MLDSIYNFLWSGPLLVLLFVTGLYLTIKLRGLQLRYLGHAMRLVCLPFSKKKSTENKFGHKVKGDIGPFQALMIAIAGAVGTGNIAGIAIAVTVGGFGALFWIWVIAFLGMVTAYSEALLGVKFRVTNQAGKMSGGPMYTLSRGLKAPKLAVIFAIFGVLASFGIGSTVQANSVADAFNAMFAMDRTLIGVILMLVTGVVILGGVTSIGRVAGYLVPSMAILYIAMGLIIIGLNIDKLLPALQMIITSAFTGKAVTGGFIGSGMFLAMQIGVQRGVFSNEAGLGSLSIAASSARTSQPAQQGMLAMAGVFISTMLICTVTGLMLAVTDVVGQSDGLLTGAPLVLLAVKTVFAPLQYVVLLGLCLFAFTTILGWAYYGEKCVEYLVGVKIAYGYRWVYTVSVLIGALLELELVWEFADIANGLMAIPNLIAIAGLAHVVQRETNNYLREVR